jgi:alginate O-acetyltransferase complex protein AlgI
MTTAITFLIFTLALVVAIQVLTMKHYTSILLMASVLFIAYLNVYALVIAVLISTLNYYAALKSLHHKSIYRLLIFFNIAAVLFLSHTFFTTLHFHSLFIRNHFTVGASIGLLGISFYTLQNIGYIIDVRNQRIKPSENLSEYLLYNLYFPKFISGPILSHTEFTNQLNKVQLSNAKMVEGLNRLALGLFKKMVIADRLAPAVVSVFDFSNQYAGITYWSAACIFTLQLYFDFSAYTDMAIGASKLLGIDLKENFQMPFRSRSVTEFWRGWHITLMFWLTNYIFYPIVYRWRKHKKEAAIIGILLTFFISGIWHGIGFTFIIYAMINGIVLCIEFLTKNQRTRLNKLFNSRLYNWFCTLLVFAAVSFSFIYFRANSTQQANELVVSIFASPHFLPSNWLAEFIAPLAVGGHQIELFNLLLSLFFALVFVFSEAKIIQLFHSDKLKPLGLFVLIFLIVLFGVFNGGSQFIYVQF